MNKKEQLKIFKSISTCLGDTSLNWMDPNPCLMDPEESDDNFGEISKDVGRCVGYHQLVILELYSDISPESSNTDAEIGKHVRECMENDLYDKGNMRIYEMVIAEDENSVGMHLMACGIGSDSDTIFPDFKYNTTIGEWVAIDDPTSENPWIALLSFEHYTTTLFQLLLKISM